MCRIGRSGLVESVGRLDSAVFIVFMSESFNDHVNTANTEWLNMLNDCLGGDFLLIIDSAPGCEKCLLRQVHNQQ
jgi:hypothetical protein